VDAHRPARTWPRQVPVRELVVAAPPHRSARAGTAAWPLVPFSLLTLAAGVAFVRYSPSPALVLVVGVLAAGLLGLVAIIGLQRSRRRRRAAGERARYLRYLDGVAEELAETARLQDRAARLVHPGPTELWAIACEGERVWERAIGHADFATARVGCGPVPLATRARLEGGDVAAGRDPVALAEARDLVEEWRELPEQPLVVDLRADRSLSLAGPRALTRALARAIVLELAVLCSPRDLLVAIRHPAEAAAEWGFAKWLPHAFSGDGLVLLCGDGDGLAEVLAAEDPRRHRLLVADGPAPDLAGLAAGAVVLVEAGRDGTEATGVRVRVEEDLRLTLTGPGERVLHGRAEGADPVLCEVAARRLAARWRADEGPPPARLADLLGIGGPDDPRPELTWRERPAGERFRVPVGVDAGGEPVFLDLREPEQGGMGAHGLVTGGDGSERGELLRAVAAGLAVTHPPELLAMVLVDCGGGGTFAGMAELPHVAGAVAGLADDNGLAGGVRDALAGELARRSELVRAPSGAGLAPRPLLLVAVDGFGELVTGRPDLADLFAAIGRSGASLGMHLLLASRLPGEGWPPAAARHLGWRVALRAGWAELRAGRSCGSVPDSPCRSASRPSPPRTGRRRRPSSSSPGGRSGRPSRQRPPRSRRWCAGCAAPPRVPARSCPRRADHVTL
jgi:S-DNA-T family DNA segregation ATPase FtsK/SpoIIIE